MHTCNEIQRHPNRKDILNIGDFHSLTGFFYSYLPIEKISKKFLAQDQVDLNFSSKKEFKTIQRSVPSLKSVFSSKRDLLRENQKQFVEKKVVLDFLLT